MTMATKNNTRNKQKHSTDTTAYKVVVALALLCAGLVALKKVHAVYSTVGGMDLMDAFLPYLIAAGFGLCAVCIALHAFWKNAVCKAIAPWLAFVFAMVGITALSMKVEYTFGFPFLYFLWAAALVHYIIYQLYRWEFFLFSLPTAMAGFLFYHFRNGFTPSVKNLFLLLAAAVILICVLLIAAIAAKNKGHLALGKHSVRLFSKRYNPFLHYLVAILWLVCIPAALLLGNLFSFYFMFAAIAVEFIAAVYYTFQLN